VHRLCIVTVDKNAGREFEIFSSKLVRCSAYDTIPPTVMAHKKYTKMNKHFILSGFIAIILIFTSCNKEDDEVVEWNLYNVHEGYEEFNAIAFDIEGNLWVGGTGLWKYDGTSWIRYNIEDGIEDDYVNDLKIDNEGNIWVGTRYNVSKFDGTHWTSYNFSTDQASVYNVKTIAIDASGNKWFGSYGWGVTKFNGIYWTTYNTENGLAFDWVNSICFDNEGNKWFGTQDGLSKFNDINWVTYTVDDGLTHNCVFSIAFDILGNLGITTMEGFSKFDGTNWTSFDIEGQSISVDAQNNMWIGGRSSICRLDVNNQVRYYGHDSLNMHKINCITIDSFGNKWIGTSGENGVYMLKIIND
jgi:ligand-binding sensor domain-containing protein